MPTVPKQIRELRLLSAVVEQAIKDYVGTPEALRDLSKAQIAKTQSSARRFLLSHGNDGIEKTLKELGFVNIDISGLRQRAVYMNYKQGRANLSKNSLFNRH